MKKIFLKGDLNNFNLEQFQNEILFSRIEMKNKKIQAFKLTKEKEESIKRQSIADVVSFYNSFDRHFIELEKEIGINIWFLEHFRTNFRLIEKRLNDETESLFKKEYPKGDILNVKNSTSNNFKKIKRIFKEIVYILSGAFNSVELKGTIIIHDEKFKGYSTEGLFGKLARNYPILKIRSLFDLKKELPEQKLLMEYLNSDSLLFRSLLTPSTYIALLRFYRKIKRLEVNLRRNISSESEKEILNLFFSNHLYFCILYLRMISFSKLFKKGIITSFFISDENSPQQKVIQYAAKLNQVNIYAIQHGAIYKNHFAYDYGGYNNKPLLPDITFTWGEFYNEVLIEQCGYLPHQIKAVGSLRKQIITSKAKNSDNSVKIALFASQPIPNKIIRDNYLLDIFSTFNQLGEEYFLIIRPHPNEKDDSYFSDFADQLGFSNYKIERGVSLEEQFKKCDLLITAYSTVGAEFIEYYKPLLILDYFKEDIVGYLKEGVGIEIDSKEKLLIVLSKLSSEINHEKYDLFIERYFHSIDGNTSKRIEQTIKDK